MTATLTPADLADLLKAGGVPADTTSYCGALAVAMLQADTAPLVVSAVLGHAATGTTVAHYLRLDVENLRPHYALTLRDWCANLVRNWDDAVAEVGVATAKVWGMYMAGSRVGFETNVVQLHQVLAVKLDEHGADGGLPLRPWWTP